MPRKHLILTDIYPYHVTNRSNNREFFYLDLEALWCIFLDILIHISLQYECRIHAFVLMSNHYHLVLSTPQKNLGEAMKYFHRETARRANKSAQRINHFFGGRYKWCLLNRETYYWNTIKYIFRNPVTANLCKRVEDYPFSSFNTDYEEISWKLFDFLGPNHGIKLDLNWLNQEFSKEQKDGISAALRRREFKISCNPSSYLIELDEVRLEKGTVT
jgi:putative transposase